MRVSMKTIRRDLRLFRQVGLPVEETPGAFGSKTWRPRSYHPAPGRVLPGRLQAGEEGCRTWRIDRIEQAELERMPFTLPADLDWDARLAGSLGIDDGHEDVSVTVRFQAVAVRFVQRKHWHASQHLTRQRRRQPADGTAPVLPADVPLVTVDGSQSPHRNRLVLADHKVPAGHEMRCQPLQDLAPQRLGKVSGDQIAAQDDVKRLGRRLTPDVLLAKVDLFSEFLTKSLSKNRLGKLVKPGNFQAGPSRRNGFLDKL